MSEQPSDEPPKRKRRAPRHQDKEWLFLSYSIAREYVADLPLGDGSPVSWDVGRTVAIVLERLDALDALDELEPVRSPPNFHFQQARLYIGALGHLDRLYRHAQEPSLKGEALWRRAFEVRAGLRKLLDELASDGVLMLEEETPQRRGDSARSVGNELLELVRVCHKYSSCFEEYDKDLDARLSDARLQAERLLTSIGDRDAPTITRELRREHQRMCEAFAMEWRGLRGLLAAHGCNEHEVERLAPSL